MLPRRVPLPAMIGDGWLGGRDRQGGAKGVADLQGAARPVQTRDDGVGVGCEVDQNEIGSAYLKTVARPRTMPKERFGVMTSTPPGDLRMQAFGRHPAV